MNKGEATIRKECQLGGLTGRAESVRRFLEEFCVTNELHNGGGHNFRTVEQHRAQGESYGLESLFIIIHECSDLAPYFSLDYERYKACEKMVDQLAKLGVWTEQCTSWYSAVYPL